MIVLLWLLHVHGRFLRSAEVIQFGVTGEFSHKFFPRAGRGFRYDVEQYQKKLFGYCVWKKVTIIDLKILKNICSYSIM